MADKKDPPKAAPAGVNPAPVKIGGESLVDRIVPHIKKILIMVVVVAVVISVILVIRWRGEVGREKATAKLIEVMEIARKRVVPAPTPVPGQPEPKPDPDTFTDAKTRAEAVLASLDSTGATSLSSFRGGLLFDAGRIDDAIAEYRKGIGEKGLEGVLCREGLGIAQETKALSEKDNAAKQRGLEEALATFATMQTDEAGPRYAYALYHQGRLQQTLGKTAEAKALYEKARPLADKVESPTQDPSTDAQLLSAMIDRRLTAL
ncbi:MAG: hypothetical protein JNL83_37625 [Myxococcales bacterium]|nr:hypothetical protein [Myxococcales bacterium]